ncbi:hypothetical protein HDV01_003247 [Terramyces sp. JEL0728]|nr:hypothetical protein HDV01_003247 [Terramyces sp. JEL0728]
MSANINAVGLQSKIFTYGKGVEPDYAKAFERYKNAADKGNSSAQYNLGKLYEDKDLSTALEWYQKAANQGNTSARQKIESLTRPLPHLKQNTFTRR